MIKEPESRFKGEPSDDVILSYPYEVEHNGEKHKCLTSVYASYLAEKFDAKIWDVVLEKFIKPYIGNCDYCKKHNSLHLVDGHRGSFPSEDDTFACYECDSVYRIVDILMATGAYKTNQ